MKQREIKFRAWNGEEMIYTEVVPRPHTDRLGYDETRYTVVPGDGYHSDWLIIEPSDDNVELQELDNLALMQYTELKDKNGKEIYEGDIVHCDIDVPLLGKRAFYCSIEYFDSMAAYQVCLPNGKTSFYLEDRELEVVGNIYQDPELLKD